ncbi:DNA-directed RNA polymerase subunit H [Candidatus Bathyarchaeota archaeon]|nr:DNA-directed RNA polymerase subunit H [Candidatus Bathyarchaeota archaeon]
MVVGGVYTYSSRSFAEKWGIELIEPSLPAFDVFEHELVPRHEILSEEEKQKVLDRFHAKPYQFPWIKASDPISIILGAKPGDMIKITGRSLTAGVYESYRYVVK